MTGFGPRDGHVVFRFRGSLISVAGAALIGNCPAQPRKRVYKMEAQSFTFATSPFVPVAIGFFGLGTGYFIWGAQALFGFPKTSPAVNRTLGLWGFWMPGFMQFITGVYLLIGLTWFNVFGNVAPLYMAGLAFTAYGIHWFAMAHRSYIEASAGPDGWMAIAFLFLSVLGVDVFRRAD